MPKSSQDSLRRGIREITEEGGDNAQKRKGTGREAVQSNERGTWVALAVGEQLALVGRSVGNI